MLLFFYLIPIILSMYLFIDDDYIDLLKKISIVACFKKILLFIKNFFAFIIYLFWLFKEITLSSLYVVIIILSSKISINPKFFIFKSELQKDNYLTLLAHSITLTPGTATVRSLDKNSLLIHTLNADKSTKIGIKKIKSKIISFFS